MRVTFIGLVLTLGCTFVNAKQCYLCYRLESNNEFLDGDEGCVSGDNVSDDNLIESCEWGSKQTPFAVSVSPKISQKIASFVADLGKAGNATEVHPKATEEGCFKLVHDGRVSGLNGNYKMINRGCIQADPFPEETCKTKTMAQWEQDEDLLAQLVWYVGDLVGFESNAQATVCICKKDKCNGSTARGGSNSVFTQKTFTWFWLVGFVLASSKKFCYN